MIASTIARDDQRLFGSNERLGNGLKLRRCEPAEFRRPPPCGIEVVGFNFLLHCLAGANEVDGPTGLGRGETQSAVDELLDVPPPFDLGGVAAVLRHDRLLIRHILNPMDILCAASTILTLDRVWTQPGEYEHGGATTGGIVDSGTEALGADVDMYDDGLRTVGQAGISVSHGEGDHFIGTGDDAWEGVRRFTLAFDHGLQDAGVVGAQVHEAVRHTGFPERLEEGE